MDPIESDNEYDTIVRGIFGSSPATLDTTTQRDNQRALSLPQKNKTPNIGTAAYSRLVKVANRDEVVKLLECPICYDIVLPPIHTCLYGHNICFSCRRHVQKCPVCRADFSEIRNIFAEQLLEKCMISCKNIEAGCTVVVPGDRVTSHQFFCEFRPIRCPDCEKMIEFHKFLQHLRDENVPIHIGPECPTGYEIAGSGDDTQGGTQVWEPTWIQAFNYNFFGILESDKINWWFWVGCFGSIVEASQFQCEIILWNKDKAMDLRYCGPVQSLRTTSREVIYRGECLVTARPVINAYTRHGGVDVMIKISRLPYHSPVLIIENNEDQINITSDQEPSNNSINSSAYSTTSLSNESGTSHEPTTIEQDHENNHIYEENENPQEEEDELDDENQMIRQEIVPSQQQELGDEVQSLQGVQIMANNNNNTTTSGTGQRRVFRNTYIFFNDEFSNQQTTNNRTSSHDIEELPPPLTLVRRHSSEPISMRIDGETSRRQYRRFSFEPARSFL